MSTRYSSWSQFFDRQAFNIVVVIIAMAFLAIPYGIYTSSQLPLNNINLYFTCKDPEMIPYKTGHSDTVLCGYPAIQKQKE